MKIGLSSCGKVLNDALFASYRQAGIDLMEISCSNSAFESLDFAMLRKSAEKYGVTLWSLHLPFTPFSEVNIASEDDSVRTHTVSLYRSLISKGADIGIRKFIVHPSGEPNTPQNRAQRLAYAKETLKILADFAASLSCTICIEDLPRTCLGNCSVEIEELLCADERLRVCFDTNHLLTESNEDFISRVGSKIVTTHVSDYDFIDEKHWLPGEGLQDWNKLFEALQNCRYDSAWLYELDYEAPKSITRPRDLTPEDFVANAKAIFEGNVPETIR